MPHVSRQNYLQQQRRVQEQRGGAKYLAACNEIPGAEYRVFHSQGMIGLTLAAASFARTRAVSTSSAVASATPMRRRANDSGLPNRRISAPGTRKASATPSNAMPAASCCP